MLDGRKQHGTRKPLLGYQLLYPLKLAGTSGPMAHRATFWVWEVSPNHEENLSVVQLLIITPSVYPEDGRPRVGLAASSPGMYQGKLRLSLGHGKCPD